MSNWRQRHLACPSSDTPRVLSHRPPIPKVRRIMVALPQPVFRIGPRLRVSALAGIVAVVALVATIAAAIPAPAPSLAERVRADSLLLSRSLPAQRYDSL